METVDTKRLMAHWINERHSIYLKKCRKEPKPWTTDPILQQYRFCNVYREMDKESVWIHRNWLYPNEAHPLLFVNMALARFINWSPTLEYIGYQYTWKPKQLKAKLKEREASGEKVWTGAYIVSTNGKKLNKIDYIVDVVLAPLVAEGRNPQQGESLEHYWKELIKFDGIGSFMAAQIVADLKFARVMHKAPDWWDWAALGPGSIRGLNRMYNRDIKTHIPQKEGLAMMRNLLQDIMPMLHSHVTEISMQDFQNCLCEFDKYVRVLKNEGKPRSKYNGEN